MTMNIAVFKIGGKILDNSNNLINTIAQLTQLFVDKAIKKIILIPGGGLLANFVRSIYREFKFNDDLAHWIAIYSMDYNGIELKRKFPHLKLCDNYEKLEQENRGMFIFLPYKYLKKHDELPHTWDVTSDSITLFLAKELGLSECFLIKDVDGILNDKNEVIKEIPVSKFKEMRELGKLFKIKSNVEELKERTNPIDPFVTTLIEKYNISCIILNGSKNKTRIFNYFKSASKEEKIYTKIK